MLRSPLPSILAAFFLWAARPAHASLLPPELEDTVANVISWVALIVAPVVVVGLFWFVHIMPEKIAEKRKHPQAKAIQALCLLSLFFGGLLWPLAWLWAYTKPVLHKLAYGTDVDDSAHGPAPAAPATDRAADLARLQELEAEMHQLQARLASAPDAPPVAPAIPVQTARGDI